MWLRGKNELVKSLVLTVCEVVKSPISAKNNVSLIIFSAIILCCFGNSCNFMPTLHPYTSKRFSGNLGRLKCSFTFRSASSYAFFVDFERFGRSVPLSESDRSGVSVSLSTSDRPDVGVSLSTSDRPGVGVSLLTTDRPGVGGSCSTLESLYCDEKCSCKKEIQGLVFS